VDLKTTAAKEAAISARVAPKSSRGRPKKPASRRAVEEATGISRREVERVERHVTLAEQYPVLQRPGWQRHHVLDAGDLLEKLPEGQRAPIAALLDQDAIPPTTTIACLSHAVSMPVAKRQAIIRLAGSEEEFDRRRALTAIANVPGRRLTPASSRSSRWNGKVAAPCRSPRFKARLVAHAATTKKRQTCRGGR